MSVTNYPLFWPEGFPRSKAREYGRFKTGYNAARDNVEKSLAGFARDSRKVVTNLIISSNVTIGGSTPTDPGIAVWFTWDDMQVCIPVDRYSQPAHNLQAVHHIIEARRVELRHGTLALVRATFTGFKALPSPRSCWEILGLKPNAAPEAINDAYKTKAKDAHPDRGGSDTAMAELNRARASALKEIGA